MLDSAGVKAGAATHPKHPGVAGLAVVGVGFPVARVEIRCRPSGIVSKLVDALAVRDQGKLRGKSGGQSQEQYEQPISHERTPRNNSSLRQTRDGQEFARENLIG